MINLRNISKIDPYLEFIDIYQEALGASQKDIQAVCISSYNKNKKEVTSRYVNLKYIVDDKFYFYSNYLSPKAIDFKSHDQISALFFWNKINAQIRIKAKIFKATNNESNKYFAKRDLNKNALSISSKQSEEISDYEQIVRNFIEVRDNKSIKKHERPSYWGGYYFTPYYIEFWKGKENRLNFRKEYVLEKNSWTSRYLQP